MKTIIWIILTIVSSTVAWAENPRAASNLNSTTIVVATQRPDALSPLISTGFSDSSFDYGKAKEGLRPENKSMCYIGDPEGVCTLIRSYERSMKRNYRSGDHDTIHVHECRVNNDKNVETVYWLTDDYGGDLRVRREIKACP